jgi:hypothetical protein
MNVVQPASWLRICAGKSEVAPDEQLLDFVADRIGNPMIDERMARSHENLKMIRFEGELLPNWARLLDLASGLCAVPEETRRWFSALTNSNGVEDGRTVVEHCELLRGDAEAPGRGVE